MEKGFLSAIISAIAVGALVVLGSKIALGAATLIFALWMFIGLAGITNRLK